MKKLQAVFIVLVMVLVLGVLASTVLAAEQMTLNIDNVRPFSDDNGDGEINDTYILRIKGLMNRVFKIGEATSNPNVLDFSKTLYCLRFGLGFGDGTRSISSTNTTYTKLGNVIEDATTIVNYYKTLADQPDLDQEYQYSEGGTNYTFTPYNSILWLVDNMALPTTVQSSVNKLIQDAGIQNPVLTIDDVDVAQQLALWYFSNYDEDFLRDIEISNVLKMSINGSVDDYDDFPRTRDTQIETLYNYLINTARKNGSSRPTEETITAPSVSLDETLTQNVIEKDYTYHGENNTYYVVGPFKVNGAQNNNWDINVTCNFGYKNSTSAATFTNIPNALVITIDNNEVTNWNYNVANGGEFYVAINKDNIEGSIVEFKLGIDYTYSRIDRTATVWTATAEDQPVLYIEEEPIADSGDDEIVVDNRKPDFALRKYITAIDRAGESVEIDSREPRLNEDDINAILANGTADYRHLKAPVEVMKDDIVIYNISVYNEGQVDGKVTKIVDHLPQGLVLDETTTTTLANGKYTYTVNGNDVIITITDDYTLAAFTGDDLSSYTIKLACKVNADANAQDQVLTNIAEISEFWTATGKSDRDSTPNSPAIPSDLTNYWGKNRQTATNPGSTNPESYYLGQEDDDDFEKVFIKGVNVDFSLRKYITKVERDGENITITSRVPAIDISKILPKKGLKGEVTTATYKHLKAPVTVKPGDKVTYTITVYNEGSVEGKVSEVIDHLPQGLTFDTESNPEFIAAKGSYTPDELSTYKYSYQIVGNKLVIKYLEDYTLAPLTTTSTKLDSKEISIVFKVTAEQRDEDQVLTNIAEITEYVVDGNVINNENEEMATITDRDSSPEDATIPENLAAANDYWGKDGQTAQRPGATNPESYYEGQSDDDDFEKVIIKGVNFDLALRKFISSVKRNGNEILDGSREPIVDTSTIAIIGTASYTHPKTPVVVKNGDIVTYTIRVYNEGDVDGYADLITDHIPEGLEFITDSEKNTNYLWEFQSAENISVISTSYWSKERTDQGYVNGLIKAYNPELTADDIEEGEFWQQSANGTDGLFYRDVEIEFKVVASNTFTGNIVNIAEISESTPVDDNNNPIDVEDNDSPNPVDLEDYPLHPAPENSTIQEDDDDYEIIQLKFFDLALRKFITAVNDTQVTGRVPEAVYNEEKEQIEYVHPKTPVEVSNGDYVTYTIRVYNEGTIAGYAELVSDDIPVGLVYIPDNETNRTYRWKMIDANGEETTNIQEAVRLTTDYLSEANGEAMMSEGDLVNPNLINAFNPDQPISNVEPYNPDFRDIKIVFQIDQTQIPDDRIVINHAQITDDSDDDEDSTPDEWIDTDDDQDIEKVYVRIFDLSLQKWVTHTIVTVDGETVVTETGFGPNVGLTEQDGRPNSENEPIAQVVIDKKKLNSTVVKFVYSIRVANEGDIAGYATEITDYIPEGLMFVEEDNPLWTKVGDDRIVTHALEESLLEPGDSAVLEVVFTWINNENNLGVKRNIAAITDDYNDAADTPDIDSTPGNPILENYEKEQEDDDDYALVILTLKTGGEISYLAIGLAVLAIVATGTFFIKRFVI